MLQAGGMNSASPARGIPGFLNDSPEKSGTLSSARSHVTQRSMFNCPFTLPAGRLPAEAAVPLVLPQNKDTTTYAFLSEFVIQSAESMSFPENGEGSVSELTNRVPFPLGMPVVKSVFTTRSTKRDHKFGAAGELLIFKFLRS
ncbi:hypothetical protein HYFRA_00002250 [Hymenoscyphus fraxineus]|uniref:Uncharacterized protein n=1 Tax=Hymenoscyphus fraxineus TaxID=746836 RepID=A0A9N9KLF4_9HELO|nr:hypothetical protein HYFRA_00002250 [Hymenoscyphus fraxineus]